MIIRDWVFIAFVCASGAGGLAACGKPTGEAHASERPEVGFKIDPAHPAHNFIKIEKVEATDGASAMQVTGRVTFDENQTQRVATPIDGRVREVRVQVGDVVRPGQVLLELTSPQVGLLQAEALKAQHDFAVASKAMDRANTLRKEGAVSDREAAQIDADFKKAKADVGRTTAQLTALGLNATDPAVHVEIRAQVGGTVVERNVLRGQEVRADAALPLLTVTNLDSVWILADVYEQDLALVKPGEEVVAHVVAYPGEDFVGKVVNVGEVFDPGSRTIKVRCVVPNKDLKLKAEMFAKLELKAKSGTTALTVPSRAVLEEGDKSKIIVATGTNYQLREIEAGPQIDGRVRVLKGLSEGEQIVTDGALFLRRELDQH